MRKSDLILDREVFIAPKSIQEDEIPRDSGLWPEYAHTLVVCVDRCGEGLTEGRLYSYCSPDVHTFHSLDQMLFILEDLLDGSGLVRVWNQPRSLTAEGKKRRGRSAKTGMEEQEIPPRPGQPLAFQALQPTRGKLSSFYLRVYSRRHASMQGVLALVGHDHNSPTAFRSALELIRMLHGALQSSKPLEKQNELHE